MYPHTPHTPYGNPNAAPVTHLHPPRKQRPPWLMIGAYATGALGIGLGIIAILLFVSYRGSATAQINQLSRALDQYQSTMTSNYSSLSAQLSSINNRLSPLTRFGVYRQVCSAGPNGPATYTFPCAQQKSG